MAESRPPALRCRGIRVTYGEVTALAEVGFDLEAGRVHALVGQNGAGKTTFARAAAGLVRPDAGALSVHGREVRLGRVAEARAAGVELVHQSFALPPSFTVAEALEFGAGGGLGVFTRRRSHRRWSAHLRSLDIDVDPRRRIRDLPIETRQGVEIARALVTDAKVLILDEPTAVLPPPGIDTLFRRLRRLAGRGVTVILILHKIREVFAVAETVTVLRGGRLVAGPTAKERLEPAGVGEMIIGTAGGETLRQSDREAAVGTGGTGGTGGTEGTRVEVASTGATVGRISRPGPERREAVLRLAAVSTTDHAQGPALDDLSLEVERGEIVGVAGVEGNGQHTLVRAIAGLAALAGGEIRLGGAPVTTAGVIRRRTLGLRIIPFDRNAEGLSLTSALWENWSAGALVRRPLLAPIRPSVLRGRCVRALRAWGVDFATPDQPGGSLSGGNAQKVILARELDDEARLLVAAQPTRGLDIGATAFVWQALRSARGRGCGVLLISSDLDELFDIADRLLVMLSGRIAGEFSPPYDMAGIGRAMTGLAAGSAPGSALGSAAR